MPCQSKRLIVFSNSFPFGRGEQFLESEIPVIAEYFKEVILQPMTYGGDRTARKTPGNVLVRSPIFPERRQEKLLVSLRDIFRYPDLRREFFRFRVPLSRDRFYNHLLAVAAKTYFARHLPAMKKLVAGSTLYFYWGKGAASFIPELREFGPARVVVRVHGGDLYEEMEGNSGYLPLRPGIYGNADIICPVSEFGRRYLTRKYPHLADKVQVSRLGCGDSGPGKFEPAPGRLVLVSCANLYPVKRIPLLATLLGKVSGVDVAWHHFGDGPERSAVEAVVRQLPPNVKAVLHGRVDNSEVLSFYREHHVDAIVSVSSSEGVPVSLMEAMSFGVPALVTDAGGTAEILSREGALLLPVEFSASQFLEAISRIRGLAPRIELRQAIRRHWSAVASAEKNYRRFAKTILCPVQDLPAPVPNTPEEVCSP